MVFLRDNLKHPKMDSQTAKAVVWIFIFNRHYLWQVMNWVWCDSQKLPYHCFTTIKYVRVDPNWSDTYVWWIYLWCMYICTYTCVRVSPIPTLGDTTILWKHNVSPLYRWFTQIIAIPRVFDAWRLGEEFLWRLLYRKKNRTQSTWWEIKWKKGTINHLMLCGRLRVLSKNIFKH